MPRMPRERTLRGGPALAAGVALPSAAPARRGAPPTGPGRVAVPMRDRAVAVVAAVTLTASAGIVGWRYLQRNSDQGWAASAAATLGSVNQQLTLLAQTSQAWHTQPAQLRERRADVDAHLLQRETELEAERAHLASALAHYQQLPSLHARQAADQARVQALQQRAEQAQQSGDPTVTGQLAVALQQRQQDNEAVTIADDAVNSAKAVTLADDSGKTEQVIGLVTTLIGHPPTAPAPVPAAPAPLPNAVPPQVQVLAAPPGDGAGQNPPPATVLAPNVHIEAAPPGLLPPSTGLPTSPAIPTLPAPAGLPLAPPASRPVALPPPTRVAPVEPPHPTPHPRVQTPVHPDHDSSVGPTTDEPRSADAPPVAKHHAATDPPAVLAAPPAPTTPDTVRPAGQPVGQPSAAQPEAQPQLGVAPPAMQQPPAPPA
ncbi:MAG: hypothetical protein QOF84_3351, partial [Streptomyces sp.]|nr:hypothetical protein [Streptomyces sp.]